MLSQYREDTVLHAFEAVMSESNSTLTADRLDQVLADTSDYYGDSISFIYIFYFGTIIFILVSDSGWRGMLYR